jgi:hypothetical protein
MKSTIERKIVINKKYISERSHITRMAIINRTNEINYNEQGAITCIQNQLKSIIKKLLLKNY